MTELKMDCSRFYENQIAKLSHRIAVLEAELAALREANRWIPVGDMKFSQNTQYLIAWKNCNSVAIATYTIENYGNTKYISWQDSGGSVYRDPDFVRVVAPPEAQ